MINYFAQAVNMDIASLGLTVISAAVQAINPLMIGIFILILSAILGSGKSKNRAMLFSGVYITALFITYLIAGWALSYLLSILPINVAGYVSTFIGSLVVIVGLLEVKSYFWYSKGFNLRAPARLTKKIQKYVTKNVNVPGAIFLGAFTALIGLVLTGAPYISVIAIIHNSFDLSSVELLLRYCAVLIIPMIVIVTLIKCGYKLTLVQKWKERNKSSIRLFTGMILIALGWILILITNGTINFG